MDYELTFEFENGDTVAHVQAQRVVDDPRHEAARVDIPLEQPYVDFAAMQALLRRVQSETPAALVLSGADPGVMIAGQVAQSDGMVVLRFASPTIEEEVFLEGDCLVV